MSNLSDTVSFASLGIDRRTLNGALRGARNATMLSLVGNPRGTYDQTCRPPTNANIRALVETADLGPFRATGLKPAVASLKAIMADIEAEFPAIHAVMSTAGMLCCRLVRGSSSSISNHSWGTAIDLKLENKLDRRGDGRTQRGLLDIHPIFNRHKWFWGAAFRTEDAMHFEASDDLVREWAAAGEFGAAASTDVGILSFGDRGPDVEELQVLLNFALGMDIEADGIFGAQTRATVMEFQRVHGLVVDGVVGENTMTKLKEVTAQHAA